MSMANKRGLTIMHLLLASVFFAGCNEVSTTHYETTDDAVRDRATERGVIPQILQPDVTDIHETHDLDSGRVDGSFALNGSVVFRLKSACSPSQALPPTTAAHHWWQRSSKDGKQAPSGQSFQCGNFFVATDPANRVGYFWNYVTSDR
jgi:hypothetical protein